MKAIVFLAIVQATAFATTIHVPGDYHSIQYAIDAAASRDTVLVAPGLYQENIDFKGKAITVKSSGGPSATVIDGFGHTVVTFANFEKRDSVLEGFTVRNGAPNGIACRMSKPTIKRNVVVENAGTGINCAIPVYSEGPLIIYNKISENDASGILDQNDSIIENNFISWNLEYGISSYDPGSSRIEGNTVFSNALGGIYIMFGDHVIVTNNRIFDHPRGILTHVARTEIYGNYIFNNINTENGGGISCGLATAGMIANNVIWNNAAAVGGGIYMSAESHCTLINNTIAGNTATVMGGGVGVSKNANPTTNDTLLTDCILWGNQAPSGPALSLDGDSRVSIRYCDVEGGPSSAYILSGQLDWGDGMIDADPLFLNNAGGDFRLQQDPCQPGVINPCVDGGSSFSMNLNLLDASTRTDGETDDGMADMGMHLGAYAPPVWRTDVYRFSAATGGTVNFQLHPGGKHQSRHYLILGSGSGTQPGFPLPGGLATLPLNWDVFTDLALSLVNTPVFQEFMEQSPLWKKPVLQTGPLPGAAGISLYFAYTMDNPFDFASHPIRIEIVP